MPETLGQDESILNAKITLRVKMFRMIGMSLLQDAAAVQTTRGFVQQQLNLHEEPAVDSL